MPKYSRVILTIPNEDGFTYLIPPEMEDVIQPGMQVIVPFGHRSVSGIVLNILEELPDKLREKEIKPIHDIVFSTPVLSGEQMELLHWISDYYICYLGEAYRLIQAGLNVGQSHLLLKRSTEKINGDLPAIQLQILRNIPVDKEISLHKLQKKVKQASLNSMLIELEKKGLLERRYSRIEKKQALMSEDYFSLNPENLQNEQARERYTKILQGRITKSRQLLDYLKDRGWVSYKELKADGFSRQVVNRLLEAQLLIKHAKAIDRKFDLPYNEIVPEVELSTDQLEIVNKIAQSFTQPKFETFLLHGITGSGKTQIYIELIRKVLAKGRQAIVLIPEIVLTPQTLARFRHFFGEKVAVLHSRLSAGEKREILYRVRQGKFTIIIGPRSAIFAPVNRLGLVIVDEEHESSYKQSDAQPHYHARDVAIYRAQLNRAVVVLGSATPSFESLYNARQGIYSYCHLKKRIEARSLPRISLVDLREEWKRVGQHPVVSDSLELKIESRLLTREQVMILQNRRGYAPYILCKDCGYVATCSNCEISLTYHQIKKQLLCHYCGHIEKAPDACPECQGMDILYKGIGTQRLEEVLLDKFPHARILRMDQDTTRGKHGHLKILEEFRSGKADILLGTKMIAKGLDFQRVSLVGVVSADQGLRFPDFRSSEKVFQLLTQAAGRAGRGASSGEVVVQTLDPSHFIFKYLLTHDYLAFYEREIESRKGLKYPPFSRLILIRLEGVKLREVRQYSHVIKNFLWKANKDRLFTVLGPAPAPISRIQNIYRYNILVKQDKEQDAAMTNVRRLLKAGLFNNPDVKKWPVKVVIDVDPLEIL